MWNKIKNTFITEKETASPPAEGPYYRSDRFFYQSSLINKLGNSEKDGWYFMLRGEASRGPYPNREAAQRALDEILEEYKKVGFNARG